MIRCLRQSPEDGMFNASRRSRVNKKRVRLTHVARTGGSTSFFIHSIWHSTWRSILSPRMPPKRAPCGNPLFLQWAEGGSRVRSAAHITDQCVELRDAAREKGTKMYDVWAKACRSLAACPISYVRPRELTCLANIGPKTASILESKWLKHCEENGLPVESTPQSRCSIEELTRLTLCRKQRQRQR